MHNARPDPVIPPAIKPERRKAKRLATLHQYLKNPDSHWNRLTYAAQRWSDSGVRWSDELGFTFDLELFFLLGCQKAATQPCMMKLNQIPLKEIH